MPYTYYIFHLVLFYRVRIHFVQIKACMVRQVALNDIWMHLIMMWLE